MIVEVLGLALTLLALALLAAGGYLLALRLLGEEARRDTLALAIAALLAATADATGIALALRACGAVWIEPAHGESYVNLASLPHWALLALAVGGIARHLGAERHWPAASFLVGLTPVVVRFAATEYVDLLTGATLLSGCFFLLRWMERP